MERTRLNLEAQLAPFTDAESKRISPTDVAQFIRLDQCQRFLRLRVTEASRRGDFLRGFGVSPQDPPPLMMKGGEAFEDDVYAGIRSNRIVRHLREIAPGSRDDSSAVLETISALEPGASVMLLQPRLVAQVDHWLLRGDVDVLRLSRDASGELEALIVDIKSSETSKIEHRLQVAFYARMLSTIAGGLLPLERIQHGILYRGTGSELDDALLAERAAAARTELGADQGFLEQIVDPEPYLAAVADLVTRPESTANRIMSAPFDDVPFHLTYRCDWCRYNPFCMKWAAERDDLSLIPYLTETDKAAIQRAGVRTASELSQLKQEDEHGRLVANPDREEMAGKLATTWPVGARLDELIARAKRYRGWKGDPVRAGNVLTHRGYGSLPYSGPEQNPNLVRIFMDAQHDNQHDRVYMIGSLVTAASSAVVHPARRRAIVVCSDAPPDSADAERSLLIEWIDRTLRAVVDLAEPDEFGHARAPIHLIFFNRFDQNLFLDALARHASAIMTATPIYDFVTQLAAYDSPVATFLVDEIRELRNYPMMSQSLQSVARFLRFDWNTPRPFTKLFRERLFDYAGKFDGGDPTAPGGSPWFTSRSRFNSQIPLEYAYAAWNALPEAVPGGRDDFAPYRAVTKEDLEAFQVRRFEAMEHIASDFAGNKQTQKTSFALPDLEKFDDKAQTLAGAIQEFVTIERHVELAAWKSARLMPPERRVLAGETLIGRYDPEQQAVGVADRMREAEERRQLEERFRADYVQAHPNAKKIVLPKEQKELCAWTVDGVVVRLELDAGGLDCTLSEMLDLTGLREGDGVIVMPRTSVDERLPVAERTPFTPTPKQMLYGTRGTLERIEIQRDEDGTASAAWAYVRLRHGGPGNLPGGFIFASITKPLFDGETYTLDPDPNDWSGYYANKVAEELVAGGENALYAYLSDAGASDVAWPSEAAAAQARFLDGLTVLAEQGQFHAFEPSKRAYVGEHGADRVLLVQGPPGTGKSFTTAFAIFARIQGAMAAELPFRCVVACHTHAAIDVLMRNLAQARSDLTLIQTRFPEIFARYFDDRLLDVPLFRYRTTRDVPHAIVELRRKTELRAGEVVAADRFSAHQWAVLGATPQAVYGLIDERWKGEAFSHKFADCLVLDEASQLALPAAIMAALPLAPDGRFIVVGDHRQMPPIVKHDWGGERRRTFSEFKAFDSLFLTLLAREPAPPVIRFAQSFRLHADMAEFLRHNVYSHDGIPFHSQRRWALVARQYDDPFVKAVLDPASSIVVVLHNEASSQLSNAFEQELIEHVSQELIDERVYGEDGEDGFGVVVPHRAQRAAFAATFADFPSRVGNKPVIADTVERFQGDEREVIIVSATESDPAYLLAASGFLYEPRRLTVALSRAKRKLIIVASRSVFDLFTPDEETFEHVQLWKNLLSRACTVELWRGERNTQNVVVYGNTQLID